VIRGAAQNRDRSTGVKGTINQLRRKVGSRQRLLKYEEVYMRAYASVSEARASLGRYIDGFYNTRRPHSSLDGQTPDEAYFTALPSTPMAA
jgi:transposase InsO family protein